MLGNMISLTYDILFVNILWCWIWTVVELNLCAHSDLSRCSNTHLHTAAAHGKPVINVLNAFYSLLCEVTCWSAVCRLWYLFGLAVARACSSWPQSLLLWCPRPPLRWRRLPGPAWQRQRSDVIVSLLWLNKVRYIWACHNHCIIT